MSQIVGLGSVRSDDERIESVEEIKEHITAAAEIFGKDRLLITPDCGMRHMPRESAFNKLKNMVAARDKVVANGMSVRETEALVKRTKVYEKKEEKSKDTDPYLLDLEDELTRTIGTKVKISKKGEGGKIEIEYYSQEELERIAEIIRS